MSRKLRTDRARLVQISCRLSPVGCREFEYGVAPMFPGYYRHMLSQPHGSFPPFRENSFSAVAESLFHKMKEKIEGEDQSYLLNVNAAEYLAHIVAEFS